MLRVLLGSHEAGERHQWRQWLSEPPLEVVGVAQDGQEAIQLAMQLRPDLVLLDHALPVIDGFQAAGMISLAAPGVMQVLIGPSDGPDILRQALRAGARELVGRPITRERLRQILISVSELRWVVDTPEYQNSTDLARLPQTISITGAKGGIGKTTLSTNLAVALAKEAPGKTVLIDLYSQFGDVPTMLNLNPRRTLADLVPAGEELDVEMVEEVLERHSCGLRVAIGSVQPQPLDLFTTQFLERLIGILKRQYRYLVVDVPPILHAGTLFMLGHSHTVLLVANLFDLTTASDTKKLLEAVKGGYVPTERMRIVLNRVSKENQLQVSEIEKAFGQRVIAQIPNDGKIVPNSVNQGVPFMISNPGSPIGEAMRGLAHALTRPDAAFAPAAPAEPDRLGGWRSFLANCFAN
jgi:pilus assembly protein CpaE